MGQWVHVPDGSAILVVPSPAEPKLYPSVGGPDELTDVLDHWMDTHTGSCKVIDLLDNDQA